MASKFKGRKSKKPGGENDGESKGKWGRPKNGKGRRRTSHFTPRKRRSLTHGRGDGSASKPYRHEIKEQQEKKYNEKQKEERLRERLREKNREKIEKEIWAETETERRRNKKSKNKIRRHYKLDFEPEREIKPGGIHMYITW